MKKERFRALSLNRSFLIFYAFPAKAAHCWDTNTGKQASRSFKEYPEKKHWEILKTENLSQCWRLQALCPADRSA